MRKIIASAAAILVFFGVLFDVSAQMQNRQLSVPLGKQRVESTSKLKVKFLAVVEDSRCPEGANCIWAGAVTVKLQVMLPGKEPKTVELSTLQGREMFEYEGVSIKLVSVSPYPKLNVKIRKCEYRVLLEISRSTAPH
ncbi:MAG: hypothetical protein C4325_10860 [Blastocatellia bacterium]